MPKCLFKLFTGYDCPSCGGQRALYAFFHLDFKRAFLYNPFVFIISPYLIALLYCCFFSSRLSMSLRPIVSNSYVIAVYVILYIAWWAFRNTIWWTAICEY